jgi:hypothetical protein
MPKRAILLFAITTFLVTGLSFGGDLPKLPGSRTTATDAVAKCDEIFVGQIKKVGTGTELSPEHETRYIQQISYQPLRIFAKLRRAYRVDANVGEYHETFPNAGESDIFFVHNKAGTTNSYTVVKLLPATDDNIAMVKMLIAQISAK